MVPTRRRGNTSSESQRRENRAAPTWYGRQSSPIPAEASRVSVAVRGAPGHQARLVKTVNIQAKWAAAHPGPDRRLPGVVTHSRLLRATSVRPRVEIVLEDGSGVAVDWVTGRSYSSARRRLNVLSGQRQGRKELRLPIRALPSVIVVTEKVMREADGPVGRAALTADRTWVRLETEQKVARSPKIASDTNSFLCLKQ